MSYVHAASDASDGITLFTFWVMRRDSAKRHICGDAHPGGGYDPQIQTQPRFLYNAPTSQVSSSCVYSFRSYCVDKQTNKQLRWKTSSALRYATTLSQYNWEYALPLKWQICWYWITTIVDMPLAGTRTHHGGINEFFVACAAAAVTAHKIASYSSVMHLVPLLQMFCPGWCQLLHACILAEWLWREAIYWRRWHFVDFAVEFKIILPIFPDIFHIPRFSFQPTFPRHRNQLFRDSVSKFPLRRTTSTKESFQGNLESRVMTFSQCHVVPDVPQEFNVTEVIWIDGTNEVQ